MEKVDSVLDVLYDDEEIPAEVLKMAQERQEARLRKDFRMSDVLRDKISEKGYRIDDAAEGFKVKKK